MYLGRIQEESHIAQNRIICDCCKGNIPEGKRYFTMIDDDFVNDLNICIPCKAIIIDFCTSTMRSREFCSEDINEWLKESLCNSDCDYGQDEYGCPEESRLLCKSIKEYYAGYDWEP
jgi:hypothetical protein